MLFHSAVPSQLSSDFLFFLWSCWKITLRSAVWFPLQLLQMCSIFRLCFFFPFFVSSFTAQLRSLKDLYFYGLPWLNVLCTLYPCPTKPLWRHRISLPPGEKSTGSAHQNASEIKLAYSSHFVSNHVSIHGVGGMTLEWGEEKMVWSGRHLTSVNYLNSAFCIPQHKREMM